MDTTETIVRVFTKYDSMPMVITVSTPIPDVHTPELTMENCRAVQSYYPCGLQRGLDGVLFVYYEQEG